MGRNFRCRFHTPVGKMKFQPGQYVYIRTTMGHGRIIDRELADNGNFYAIESTSTGKINVWSENVLDLVDEDEARTWEVLES